MIPKIIHYCWFGKGEKPESVLNYIETWKKHLPDYKIKEWNESNFDITTIPYTLEAYEAKKFAFVSDVCRIYCLMKEGGIYLDTDVEVIGSFDNYLANNSFIGMETKNRLGTAVIGSMKNEKWLVDFYNIYKELHFKIRNNKFDIMPNTTRITNFFKNYSDEKPNIYPIDYFCAKDYKSKKISISKNTVCIHNFAESWVGIPKYEIYERKLWNLLHLPNLNLINKFLWTFFPKQIK